MKKGLLFVAAIAMVAMFSSCKKDYTCKCTVLGISTSAVLEKVSKSDAEDACDKSNTAAAVAGGKCELE